MPLVDSSHRVTSGKATARQTPPTSASVRGAMRVAPDHDRRSAAMPAAASKRPIASAMPAPGTAAPPTSSQKAMTGKTKKV
jgi:hypothetical protein